jgi:hypothetical protein
MADQPEILENHADPAPERRQRFSFRIAQFFAEQPDSPARRPLRKVEQLEQGRLPRTRRPGQEIEAAVVEPEIQVAQHFSARAVAQADAVEFGNRWQFAFPPQSGSAASRRACQGLSIPVYRALTVPEEGFCTQ